MNNEQKLKIDVSNYSSGFTIANKLSRLVWNVVWLIFFRPTPVIMFGWRRFLLRLFGAKLGRGAKIYPSVRIWAPWNLEMDEYSCISFGVDCYSVDKIKIGQHATVSQYTHLCTATHDPYDSHMKPVQKPIVIGDNAWICAGVYVGPGVVVGEGAIAGARAVVIKDVEPWTIVGGNPAKFIKKRVLKS